MSYSWPLCSLSPILAGLGEVGLGRALRGQALPWGCCGVLVNGDSARPAAAQLILTVTTGDSPCTDGAGCDAGAVEVGTELGPHPGSTGPWVHVSGSPVGAHRLVWGPLCLWESPGSLSRTVSCCGTGDPSLASLSPQPRVLGAGQGLPAASFLPFLGLKPSQYGVPSWGLSRGGGLSRHPAPQSDSGHPPVPTHPWGAGATVGGG